MRRIIVFLAICQCIHTATASAQAKLSERERAVVYVISAEAKHYALEARNDVCIGFSTGLSVRESKIFALHDKGLNFHPAARCNRGPGGVAISITMPSEEMPPETYEIVSGIGDNDPIRLYGDHSGNLLRKSSYIIKCKSDSQPTLETYSLICCEKGKPQRAQSPN